MYQATFMLDKDMASKLLKKTHSPNAAATVNFELMLNEAHLSKK